MADNYDEILERALKRREDFLKEHPEYQEYQDEIDRILDATLPEKRLEVMGLLLSTKLSELGSALTDLARIKSLN